MKKLKEVFEKIVEYIESDEFIFKIDEIEEMLKIDKISLNLDFVSTYVIMLKWFGTKNEWNKFALILSNILKEYGAFNLANIMSLFATLKEKFENLKEKTFLAEIKPTLS